MTPDDSHTAAPTGEGWEPIASAPTTGRAMWVDVWNGKVQRAHYAHGGGEDQPPFGPAWFRAVVDDSAKGDVLFYAEIAPPPMYWRRGSEGEGR